MRGEILRVSPFFIPIVSVSYLGPAGWQTPDSQRHVFSPLTSIKMKARPRRTYVYVDLCPYRRVGRETRAHIRVKAATDRKALIAFLKTL